MKNNTAQKWVLSAFLIAALGSQYYYSISSKTISSTDLASVADNLGDLKNAADVLQVAATSGTPIVSGTPVVSSTVQATGTTETCADCVKLTKTQADSIRKILQDIVDGKYQRVDQTTPSTAAATDPCASELTEAAKNRCKRDIALQDKKDKELQDKQDRNLEFQDKMAEAVERCNNDLDCVVSRYNSLLSRYSGRRKIDLPIALAAFKKYIEPELKARLSNSDAEAESANDLIASISSGIPLEYRSVKELMVMDVRRAAEVRAAQFQDHMKQAQVALNNKNPMEAQRLLALSQQERGEFSLDFFGNPRMGREGYFDVLSTNLQGSDSATWAYVQSNLMSPIRNLFTSSSTSTTADGGTGNNNGGARGSRGGSQIGVQNTGGVTQPMQNNGSISFQAPTNGIRGSRGARQ